MYSQRLFSPVSSLVLFAFLLFACQNNQSESSRFSAKAEAASDVYDEAEQLQPKGLRDEETLFQSALQSKGLRGEPALFQSAASQLGHWDTLKKLVRRAEISFRTPDVLRATLAIEDIVRQNGGFVLENNLTQVPERQFSTRISRDSFLETTTFQVQNRLVVRVPRAQFDTTIRAIGKWSELLDYRRIHAEDMSLNWLEKELTGLRNLRFETASQQDITQGQNKLNDRTQTREKSLIARAAADAAQLEKLRIDDAVQLSNITIDLHQLPIVHREVTARVADVAAWKPGLGNQLGKALGAGWSGMKGLLVFVVQIWPLWLLAVALWWAIRKWRFGRMQVIS